MMRTAIFLLLLSAAATALPRRLVTPLPTSLRRPYSSIVSLSKGCDDCARYGIAVRGGSYDPNAGYADYQEDGYGQEYPPTDYASSVS